MFGKLFDTVVDTALQPVRDGIEVVDGLTEGELREEAAARLGANIVVGMSTAELIEWWQSED